jgi:transcriptional regulator with XRE-family HTH domain
VIAKIIFAEKLKSERKNKSWSQEELAEKLFVSGQSVSKWRMVKII